MCLCRTVRDGRTAVIGDVVTTRSRSAILLVEDDAIIRVVVCDLLADAGYEVIEAPDGGAAIASLKAHRPPPNALCLVILDMMIPVADGMQVLQALARWDNYVPVVAVSADRSQLCRAAAAGALPRWRSRSIWTGCSRW